MIRQFIIVIGALLLLSFSAQGAESKKQAQPYLLVSQTLATGTEPSTRFAIFDPNTLENLKSQYLRLMANSEANLHHGFSTYAQKFSDQAERRSLSDHALDSIIRYQSSRGSDWIRETAKNYKELQKPIPTLLVGALLMLTTGRPLELKRSSESRLTARSELASHKAEIHFTNASMSTSVLFSTRTAADSDRYKISVSRKIANTGTEAGAIISSASKTLLASLDQRISPHLSAALSSSRSLHSPLHRGGSSGESLQLHYRILF